MKILSRLKSITKPVILPFYNELLNICSDYKNRHQIVKLRGVQGLDNKPIIYYLGTTTHNNLGDNAQYYCIRRWITQQYPDNAVYEFTAPIIVSRWFGFIKLFKKKYRPQDIIIFQSGYTTQDLGGQHELMHRLIIDALPCARILMMPQTIFFEHKENELRCSESYDKAANMLFLARDNVSFKKAQMMFPNVRVLPFPDIVTTLIGSYNFNEERNGILLCRRNDSEKFYSEGDLLKLKEHIECDLEERVDISDTTTPLNVEELHCNLEEHLETEFRKYATYKVIITDRYHGTIFSLIANSPVVVIKTTDYKVTTGVDWFNGVYNCVFYADTLDQAYDRVAEILKSNQSYELAPYFKEAYYDKLKDIFQQVK